jgi:hypothetical protein
MEDFNTASPQRSFDVIPPNTIATLQIRVRPGNVGNAGWLRRSKDGLSEALDLELTVVQGEFAKRKVWTLLTLQGTTDGHAEAARISQSKIRAILESARGVRPDDTSEAAVQARRIADYGELNNLRFIARIGVEPARSGFKAKNTVEEVITPDRTDWHHVEQVVAHQAAKDSDTPASEAAKPASTPAKIGRPRWAS